MDSYQMNFKPWPYQEKAINWVLEKQRCGLLLDMGLGKTACVLSAIEDLMYNSFEIEKVLVIAPLRVAKSTWPTEIEKWDNLNHLRYSVVCGTPKQRLAALEVTADIYIINRENLVWLITSTKFDYDMVVIDELSSFKNNQAKRFKALRKVIGRVSRVVGMTGTPAPNGLTDLWPQIYLLDQGQRLGRTITNYRNLYFQAGRSNGHIVYDYVLLPESETKIYNKIEDICISMSKEDYLDMPERIYHDVIVELDKKSNDFYKRLEKEYILELSEDEVILANSAAAMSNKLQQVANGAVYDENGDYIEIHEHKLDALGDLIEQANGQPVIVVYQYKHDKERIARRFGVQELNDDDDIKRWNRGDTPILIAHAASIGHGLNLQDGGHIIIWFGITWSLELYQQLNDRLYRQGQKQTVQVYHIVCKNTVDERILKALSNKEKVQDALIKYLKEAI